MGKKKREHCPSGATASGSFLPEIFQIVEACLLKTATWTWDNMITLINIETLMKDPKPWTQQQTPSRLRSDIHTFVFHLYLVQRDKWTSCSRRRRPICVSQIAVTL